MKIKIGHKLLTIREERAMTQAEMAHLLDISEASYSRYERDESQVSYDKIAKFADILKIPIQELLPDTMRIHGNQNHVGHGGGGFILGNQYVYIGDSIAHAQLAQENETLKNKLHELEQKIEALLKK